MTITVLSDVIAPNSLWAAGVTGRQIRLNARAQNQGGHMKINVVRSRTLRRYEFGTVPLRVQVWQTLEGLYEVTDAGAFGFLVQDPKDNSATHETGRVDLLNAGAHTYRLYKRWTSAGSTRTKDRRVTRPRASTFTLQISGVPTTSFTLNDETGVVTIPADPLASTVTWAGSFYVPVHFDNDEIDWDLVVAGHADARFATGPQIALMEVFE